MKSKAHSPRLTSWGGEVAGRRDSELSRAQPQRAITVPTYETSLRRRQVTQERVRVRESLRLYPEVPQLVRGEVQWKTGEKKEWGRYDEVAENTEERESTAELDQTARGVFEFVSESQSRAMGLRDGLG